MQLFKLIMGVCTLLLGLCMSGGAFSATACEFGQCAGEPKECHNIILQKSQNGKSLMRVCQSCVLTADGSNLSLYRIETNSDKSAVKWLSCTSGLPPFAQDYVADFNTLCETRGGIASMDGQVLKCSFFKTCAGGEHVGDMCSSDADCGSGVCQ